MVTALHIIQVILSNTTYILAFAQILLQFTASVETKYWYRTEKNYFTMGELRSYVMRHFF